MTGVATQNYAAAEADFGDYFALLKPRVMALAVFTAAVAIVAAPGDVHPVIALASMVFIAVGAGGAGALNMWWDSDIDVVMRRTRDRPVPAGRVRREDALALGLWLSAFAVVMLALTANFLAAGLLAFSIFFYVVIYSMLLKRSTPQNIVIGGAAGALPPVIGWAVATGGIGAAPILMFLLIFLWTPPHFWALALFVNDDYRRAGVPMLTVTHSSRAARTQIFVYTALLVPIGLLLSFSEAGGPVTLALVILLNVRFLLDGLALLRRGDRVAAQDGWRAEKRMFKTSLIYLFALFAGLAVDAVLRLPLESAAGMAAGDLKMALNRQHDLHARRGRQNRLVAAILGGFVVLVFCGHSGQAFRWPGHGSIRSCGPPLACRGSQ